MSNNESRVMGNERQSQPRATFNILGDCVSRDILQSGVVDGSFVVKRFVSFINPVSLLSRSTDQDFNEEIQSLSWGSAFVRRNFSLDLTSGGLDYLFSEPSDYLILDFLDARMNLLVTLDGQAISRSNIVVKNEKQVREMLGDAWQFVAYNEVPEREYIAAVRKICDEILQHYSPSQVIVHKHFGVDQYIFNSASLRDFKPETRKHVQTYNALVEKLFSEAIALLDGCHVIEFPDFVLGTNRHKWGLYPLHYSDSYYQYGRKAIDAIIEEGRKDETIILERLKWKAAVKYQELRSSFELRSVKSNGKKLRTYYDIAERLLEGGTTLLEILTKAKARKIALYGDFLVARSLKVFLESNGYEVSYMISAWNNNNICERVISPNSNDFPPADALLVCDVLAQEKTRERMQNHFPVIVTASDLLT